MPVGSLNVGGGSTQKNIVMGAANARSGKPDMGESTGQMLSARELDARQHYVTPTPAQAGRTTNMAKKSPSGTDVPYYYNNFDGLPVPYSAPSAQKEHMVLKSAIREAAGKEITASGAGGVIRTDPITEEEVQYLKSMKDQVELAKFDEYVESFIDPRQPGNMKWLMEVYPDYVSRRLQQAHTDYEYALRNQMIDSWGINTFDDLHFKYLVDQGKVDGPFLARVSPPVDASYAPGWLSPFNFQSPRKGESTLRLPFASAKVGKRPTDGPDSWAYDRSNRPLGTGHNELQLARGMYSNPTEPLDYPDSNDSRFGARAVDGLRFQ